MKKLLRVIVLTATLFSSQGWAELLNKHDCLTINQDPDYILQLIGSGQYRKANKVSKAALPSFDFKVSNSFAQYLAYAEQWVALKKPLAELPCPINTKTVTLIAQQKSDLSATKVKQLVAPFELKQAPKSAQSDIPTKAMVLIHGLTDSPFLFHDLADFFYQQGFTVRTLLLPGHGTAPSDLLDVSYQDWQQAADYIIDRTLLDFDQVYLGGFSTGGALIFNHLMQQKTVNSKIKGMLMWSPASKAKSELAWLAGYIDYLPFVDWVDKDADIDFAKYESFPFNAGAQVHKLMSKIIGDDARDANKAHNIPLFVVASEHDQTIDTASTLQLINFWHSGGNNAAKSTTLMYFGDVVKARKKLNKNIAVLAPDCLESECQKIANIAHTATTNSPDNPHYGQAGKYQNCGHYLTELADYRQCKMGEQNVKGEITEQNLALHKPLQRLTYNPYYQEMLTAIENFIADVQLNNKK
ncbi:MAG: alpha/beta hydrolase [Thalassotalea sp.]